MVDLQPIKARLAAATPGPWNWRGVESKAGTYGLIAGNGAALLEIRPSNRWPIEADTRFIAYAPDDIAALIAEVERLRGAIKEHRSKLYLDRVQGDTDHELWEVRNA